MTRRALLALAALAVAARRGGRAWDVLAATTPEPDDIPLEGDNTGWHVRATLNGVARGTFLVDTGASLCVLSPDIARRANAKRLSGHVDLRTANGVIHAPLVRLRVLAVGGIEARDVDAVVHEAAAAPLDGVLGLNFLNRYAYGIDPRRRTLQLR